MKSIAYKLENIHSKIHYVIFYWGCPSSEIATDQLNNDLAEAFIRRIFNGPECKKLSTVNASEIFDYTEATAIFVESWEYNFAECLKELAEKSNKEINFSYLSFGDKKDEAQDDIEQLVFSKFARALALRNPRGLENRCYLFCREIPANYISVPKVKTNISIIAEGLFINSKEKHASPTNKNSYDVMLGFKAEGRAQFEHDSANEGPSTEDIRRYGYAFSELMEWFQGVYNLGKGKNNNNGSNKIIKRFYDLLSSDEGKMVTRVLWIDNDYEGKGNGYEVKKQLRLLGYLLPGLKIYTLPIQEWKDKDWVKFRDDIKNKTEILRPNKLDNSEGIPRNTEPETCRIDWFDLILMDYFLGGEIKGDTIARTLMETHRDLPVFMFSLSSDIDLVNSIISNKAIDYYLHKRSALALPVKLFDFYRKKGICLLLFRESKFRKNLLGNLRFWSYNKNFLWFGNKCYHMVEHDYIHTHNDWTILNQMLPDIWDQITSDFKCDEHEIYALCMAVWLHDIGHFGNENYGDATEIRENHGLISGQAVVRNPGTYGILGKDHEKDGGMISETIKKGATIGYIKQKIREITEKSKGDATPEYFENILPYYIALICIYHSGKYPLDDDAIIWQTRSGKGIALEETDKAKDTLAAIMTVETGKGEEKHEIRPKVKDNILFLTALFRFIDGCDIRRNRIGGAQYETVRKNTVNRDRAYQLLALKNEYSSFGAGGNMKEIENTLDEMRKTVDAYKSQKGYFNECVNEIERKYNHCQTILRYIKYLDTTEGHYNLHNSFYDVIVHLENIDGKYALAIIYLSDRSEEYLTENKVKLWHQAGQGRSLLQHILLKGENELAGYIKGGFAESGKQLLRLFDGNNIDIYIFIRDENKIMHNGEGDVITELTGNEKDGIKNIITNHEKYMGEVK